MQVGYPLEMEKQCQASCRVDIGSVAFSRGATGLSHLPLCFEWILGVTVEPVLLSQWYLEWVGTSGSFGMVALPLEFLSTFKWRLLTLEVQGNAGIPFPMKQGKGPLSRDEQGKSGLFLSCGGTLGVPLKWRPVCEGTSFLRCNKGVKDPFEAQEAR